MISRLPRLGRLGLALLFFLIGIVLIDIGTPTGFVVGPVAGLSFSLSGLFFLLLGFVALSTGYDAQQEVKDIRDIVRQYQHRRLDAWEAAYQLDQAVGGIHGVRFGNGQHTIATKERRFSVPLRNREDPAAKELALAEFVIAQHRDPAAKRHSEVNLDKHMSSKHHALSLDAAVRQFEARHQRQLRELGRQAA